MLNNFYFDVFAQKWVFVIMSHVTCRMWHETCLMSNAYVDPWDMLNNFCFQVYAQKWVLVIMSHVTCHILHVTCHITHVTCYLSNAYLDPRDILNKFCFHVDAQKWVFVIMSHVTCDMWHVLCQMLMLILGTCWTIFVFMSMLKCRCLWVKMTMVFFWPHYPPLWQHQS